ncbi:unnamed protein product [Lactuca saligna]|uniref:Uncharacterized protein n=1 Tax=Lactuca saligna TaxID=75948 RepID=A0AA35ZEC1_LACSI|nr:unnamed protein product [Lactuca saligna]
MPNQIVTKEENEYDNVDNASNGDKRIPITWIYDIEEGEIVSDDVNAPMPPMDAKPDDDTTAFVDKNKIKYLGMPTHHPPATWDSQLLHNYFDTREGLGFVDPTILSSLQEITTTPDNGSLIGFEINSNNRLLVDILGINGENNVP